MGRQCSICQHPERELIDHALVCGAPHTKIAADFGVGRSAITRHNAHHLSPALLALRVAEQEAANASLVDRIQSLIARAERLLSAAEQDGRAATALTAVRELRGLLELLGKATGELDERTQVAVLNVVASADWQAIRAAMQTALEPYPEARAAVAAALLQLEPHPDARAAVAGRLLELGPGS